VSERGERERGGGEREREKERGRETEREREREGERQRGREVKGVAALLHVNQITHKHKHMSHTDT
jgi:hypothetical protein